MQDAYRAVWFAACPRVIGRTLLPFQVGHAAALDALGSPYICGGVPTFEDAVVAVWVCSRPSSSIVGADLDVVARECVRWGRAHRRMTDADKAQTVEAIARYVAQHALAPERWDRPGARKPLRVPWQFAIWHRLCGGEYTRQRMADAWDTPLAIGSAALNCDAAANGDDLLMSDDERDLLDKVRGDNGNG